MKNELSVLCFFGAALTMIMGCTSGPQYKNTQQEDSGWIEAPQSPLQGSQNGRCTVVVTKVDGVATDFVASLPGANLFTSKRALYLSAGLHKLDLEITVDDKLSYSARNPWLFETRSTPSVTFLVIAGHAYRLSGDLTKYRKVELDLWDETNGVSSRELLGSWNFAGTTTFTKENVEPVHPQRD